MALSALIYYNVIITPLPSGQLEIILPSGHSIPPSGQGVIISNSNVKSPYTYLTDRGKFQKIYKATILQQVDIVKIDEAKKLS